MVIGLWRNVGGNGERSWVADKVSMMGRKRRLPIQLYYVIAVTCRTRVSLASCVRLVLRVFVKNGPVASPQFLNSNYRPAT